MANQKPVWKTFHTVGLAAIVGCCVLIAFRPLYGAVGSWIILMGLILAFFLVAADGITGRSIGVFIDDRNKVSLSRFQMVAWTVLIMSAIGVIFTWRATTDPATSTAITLDPQLLALMGISTTSLVGSPFIKKRQGGITLAQINSQAETPKGELVLTCESKAFNCKMSVWQDRQR